MPALYTERLELVPATPAMLRAAIDAGRDACPRSRRCTRGSASTTCRPCCAPGASRDDPGHLLIMFFEEKPDLGALDGYRGPEKFELVGRDLYLHYTEGIGRSKLNVFLDRKVRERGTARNWNTVNKLARICGELEAR